MWPELVWVVWLSPGWLEKSLAICRSVRMCKFWQGGQPGLILSPDSNENDVISYSAGIPLITTGKILLTVGVQAVFSA